MKARRLHHWLAPVAAMGLIWLLASGLLLNHSHHLQLDHRPLPDRLLPLLNSAPPATTRQWQLSRHTLSEIDGQLFWNGRRLGALSVQALHPFPLGWVIIARHQLLLLDPDGLEIARLPLPADTVQLHRIQPIQLRQDNRCWQLNDSLTAWRACRLTKQPPPPSVPPQPGAMEQALAAWKVEHQLTWETLLHRAHTLRVAGQLGPWLLDLLAIMVVALLISGLRLRFRQARRPRARGS